MEQGRELKVGGMSSERCFSGYEIPISIRRETTMHAPEFYSETIL
jgi:hypothetical protein